MPERLTRADVDRIAALARLELTAAEKDLFVQQLSHVLEYAEQIQNIDTTGVPPTSHVLPRMPADRADEPRAGLSNAEALANAPDPSPHTGLFRVPKVLKPPSTRSG
jgi:aspartyl-tRNA(Asn)/glutamyl-tRNA(Gln) amidotransferase subunit C